MIKTIIFDNICLAINYHSVRKYWGIMTVILSTAVLPGNEIENSEKCICFLLDIS